MHQSVGCPARTRPDGKNRDVAGRLKPSVSCCRPSAGQLPFLSPAAASVAVAAAALQSRGRLSPQRLHVSCPAVEQDLEATSGRTHTDSDLIQALFTAEPPSITEPQEDQGKQLNKSIQAVESLPQLWELVQQQAPHFGHCQTSAGLHRLSILCQAYFKQLTSAHLASRESQQLAWMDYVEPTLQMLGQLLLRHLDSCDPWAVAISFWSYGNLQFTDEPVLAALCERGMTLIHSFTPLDCASTLVGIAKLKVRPRCHREFVDCLLGHTHELLSQVHWWGTQEITTVIWSLSKIGAAGPARRALLEGLLEMTLWRLHEFKIKELAIIICSCGRLRLRLPLQLVRITNHIAANLAVLSPQDAANVLWGCAKLDFKPGPELLERLPGVMVGRLSEFKPQEVCNLLYGYGHLRYEHRTLLDGVANACSARLHEFSTQDLCLTLWSYGMVRYSPADSTLFDTACQVLLQRGNRLLPMELVMAVKGFARAGYQPSSEFMQQIAQLAMLKLHQFKPVEYAQLLWAYAQLGYRDVPLFEAVVSHAIYMLQTWSRRLPKTTVDTIVASCDRVGLWPQMLVDVAEMRGLYLKTTRSSTADQADLMLLGSGSSSSNTSSSSNGLAVMQPPAPDAAFEHDDSSIVVTAATAAASGQHDRSGSGRSRLFKADAAVDAAPFVQQQQPEQPEQTLQQPAHVNNSFNLLIAEQHQGHPESQQQPVDAQNSLLMQMGQQQWPQQQQQQPGTLQIHKPLLQQPALPHQQLQNPNITPTTHNRGHGQVQLEQQQQQQQQQPLIPPFHRPRHLPLPLSHDDHMQQQQQQVSTISQLPLQQAAESAAASTGSYPIYPGDPQQQQQQLRPFNTVTASHSSGNGSNLNGGISSPGSQQNMLLL